MAYLNATAYGDSYPHPYATADTHSYSYGHAATDTHCYSSPAAFPGVL